MEGGCKFPPVLFISLSLSVPLADGTGLLSATLLSWILGRVKLIQESESAEGFSVLVICYKADFRNFLPHPSISGALSWACVSKAWLSSFCLRCFQQKSSTLTSAEVCMNAVVSMALQAPFSCFPVTVGQIRRCVCCYPELSYWLCLQHEIKMWPHWCFCNIGKKRQVTVLAFKRSPLQVENDWKQKLSIEGRNPEQMNH